LSVEPSVENVESVTVSATESNDKNDTTDDLDQDEEGENSYSEDFSFGLSSESDDEPLSMEGDDEKGPSLSQSERVRVAARLKRLPTVSPREIEKALVQRGYRGQEYARRAGSVLAYRHMQRLRRDFVENVSEENLALRENYLFLGATGSGKTFLTEMLFKDILGVPTVVADMTRYSETGYIGDDVLMLLSELFEAAGQDRAWASCGVICLDEFDKLAASRSAARFAGEGTTKDVSGFGVQRGLLNLLSGRSSPFPTDYGYSAFGQRLIMPLHNIMFVACGAFSGLKQVADLAEGGGAASIGFLAQNKREIDDSLVSKIGFALLEDTRAFSNYGILPELVGRFSRMVPFQPLSTEVLRAILEDNVLKSYRKEFASEKVDLLVEEAVIDHIIESARRRETGARAVRAALVPHLEEAAFKTFGEGGGASVRLVVKKGEIEIQVSFQA
jgi:ATP-dependent Clp protease ATP-binding subunit ClpX